MGHDEIPTVSNERAERLAWLQDRLATLTLGDVVSPDELLDLATGLLAGNLVARVSDDFLPPFLVRELARATERKDTVQDWLPPAVQIQLAEILSNTSAQELTLLRQLLQQPMVRDVIRAVTKEILERFVQTLKPGGKGGGVLGSIGRSTFGIAGAMGGRVFRRVMEQFESQLSGAVRRFIDTSMDAVLQRLANHLKGPDAAARLSKMKLSILKALLGSSVAEVLQLAQQLPISEFLKMARPILAHNLQRETVSSALPIEIAHVLDSLDRAPSVLSELFSSNSSQLSAILKRFCELD